MLKGKIYKTKELSDIELNTMFDLMSLYYQNIKKENFISDFQKKDDVVILKDEADGEIKGFSTIMFYDLKIQNKTIKTLFSGDTIIDKAFWAKNNLASIWLQYAIQKQKEFKEPLYWILISKGYKTYKYLSTFFKDYYPNPNKLTPDFEQEILDNFCETFYKNEYIKTSGILKMSGKKDYLKEEYAKIPINKLKDECISFFLKKNPEYYKGDELVCITKLAGENVNDAGKRLLGI